MSKIQWTQETWNPVAGCDKVSEGCKNCYAISMAYRLMSIRDTADKYAGLVEKTGGGKLNWTGKINLHEESLRKPLENRKPTMYFVNSMSDLFHESVPFEFIDKVYAVMAVTPHHTYQILTKRADRMVEYYERVKNGKTKWAIQSVEYEDSNNAVMSAASKWAYDNIVFNERNWPLSNVWLGVSVENQKAANDRIPKLLSVPAAVRWLSCEPLLGPVDLTEVELPREYNFRPYISANINCLTTMDDEHYYNSHNAIDWVVVGGESGKDARPMHPDWAKNLLDQCRAAGVPFFFKQWGEYLPHCQITSLKGIDTTKAVLFPSPHNPSKMNTYYKVGKKISGEKLNGVEYKQYPVLKEVAE